MQNLKINANLGLVFYKKRIYSMTTKIAIFKEKNIRKTLQKLRKTVYFVQYTAQTLHYSILLLLYAHESGA
jgi:hypothetical protein